MRVATGSLFVVVIAMCGCNSEKKIWQEVGPQALTVRDSLRRLADLPLPPVVSDGFTVTEPVRHVNQGGDTLVLFANNLRALDHAPFESASYPQMAIGYEPDLATAFNWIDHGKIPSGYAEGAREKLDPILRSKKVLILKVLDHDSPGVGRVGGFRPGVYRAEAHLVTLDGRHLGAVRFRGWNSESVTVTRTDFSGLERDLFSNALEQLDVKLKRLMPGFQLPHMFGYDAATVPLD